MDVNEIIGRVEERIILDEIMDSPKAQLAVVYGRRRVGKSFLLRMHLKTQIVLDYSGIHNITTPVQLQQFTNALSAQLNNGIGIPVPSNWFDAFDLLDKLLLTKKRRKKMAILLDEFPWMQTPKSNFLAAFEQYWNTKATYQSNLVIIICGSSASWMIKKVLHNKGGLHNRVTRSISLQPYTLQESELFLKSRGHKLNHYQLAQLYMALGGIPHYLESARPGKSAMQIIDETCFSKKGALYNEFEELYQSLFLDAERHYRVVRALAAKPMGLSRTQLITAAKLQTGGSTTLLLHELSASGFITPYIPFGKKSKDAIYKLTDEFSLFYLRFMDANRGGEKGTWLRLSDTPVWKSWSGLAFETLCLKHTEAIKLALGISGIYTETSIWRSTSKKAGALGAQIDLLITRRDNCIHLCEMKFHKEIFAVDKTYAQLLQQKMQVFRHETGTTKQLFITLITSNGFEPNENSIGLADIHIHLDQLFAPVAYSA